MHCKGREGRKIQKKWKGERKRRKAVRILNCISHGKGHHQRTLLFDWCPVFLFQLLYECLSLFWMLITPSPFSVHTIKRLCQDLSITLTSHTAFYMLYLNLYMAVYCFYHLLESWNKRKQKKKKLAGLKLSKYVAFRFWTMYVNAVSLFSCLYSWYSFDDGWWAVTFLQLYILVFFFAF